MRHDVMTLEFIYLDTVRVAGSCERGNERSGSIHKSCEISYLGEPILTSQEGFCSRELVILNSRIKR
jgi:hypothetical protein